MFLVKKNVSPFFNPSDIWYFGGIKFIGEMSVWVKKKLFMIKEF